MGREKALVISKPPELGPGRCSKSQRAGKTKIGGANLGRGEGTGDPARWDRSAGNSVREIHRRKERGEDSSSPVSCLRSSDRPSRPALALAISESIAAPVGASNLPTFGRYLNHLIARDRQ